MDKPTAPRDNRPQNKDEEENNKKLHKFINEFVDKDVREYVRMTYLGREYSILKSRGGKYRKIEEIRKWVDKN